MKIVKPAVVALSAAMAIALLPNQAQPAVAQPAVTGDQVVTGSTVGSLPGQWMMPRVENNVLVIGPNRISLEHVGFAAGAIAALIAALSVFGGSSQGSNNSGTTSPPEEPDWLPSRSLENRAVPKDGTIIAEPGAVLHVSAGIDQPKTVLMNPKIMQPPGVGEILVVNVTASTPIGVVGRVSQFIALDNGLVELTVEAVTLAEAYEDFSFDVDFTLRDAIIYDAGDVAMNAPQAFARSAGSPSTMSIPPLASQWTCESGRDPRVEMGSVMEIKGKAQFDLWDRYAKFELEQKNDLYVELLGALEEKCELSEDILPRVWIPIWGPLGFELGPEVSLTASATGGVKLSVNTTTTVGAVFDGNESKPIYRPSSQPLTPSVEGKASADVFVGLKGALKGEIGVADAGLFVQGGPGLVAEVVSGPRLDELCLQADLYGALTAGIEAEVKWIWDWEAKLPGTTLVKLSIYDGCPEGRDEPGDSTGESAQPTRPVPPQDEFYTRPGELTNLTIYPQLATRIDSTEDGRSVYYGNYWAGTNIAVGGRSYGVASDWVYKDNGFEVLASPTVTGSGAPWDPFVVTTTVRAGDSGLVIDQLDVFEDLTGRYHTVISVRNTSEVAQDFVLYRAADCYLNRNDYGTGAVFDGGASCIATDGRRITLTDGSGDVRSAAGRYDAIWNAVVDGTEFANEATPGHYDNGMGISWSRTIAPGASMNFTSTFQLEEPANR